MKFTETIYTNKREILKFPDHYVNLAVTVDDADVPANSEGRKVVPAGTIIGGGFLSDPAVRAVKATTLDGVSNAEGILLDDVDVTHGPASGAAIIHGFIDENKLPAAPTTEERAALKQVTFLK
ncbi:hypothetical protein [Bacillus thermotolerans]|uniref:Head decoration protein n=1 Tax=Bacillus thermotolerans TaxID=1221996 RepID=A0A0F5HZF5_BACTR|nr:hypothetical protein [Bacillus thermotolerans]KKB34638.1 hypothetical protein QY97_02188 [Bacillus thermotolerans]KKB38588.1 hypothetical protein QY95_02586 [Bacillus thermotolerans]